MRPKKIRLNFRYETVERNASTPASFEDSSKWCSPAGLAQC